MTRFIFATFVVSLAIAAHSRAHAQERTSSPRWVNEYDAQVLVGAPITQPAVLRNYGPVDLGGGGTRVGNGDEPAIDTTLYANYYNPSFVGYRGFTGNYASYGGMGYGGHPLGLSNSPAYLYRSRYLYPYRYYPPGTGFSIYNPYFPSNNTFYGGYASPYWTGYGGFGFPYHFGAFGSGGAGYTFGGFGQPYRYGVFGYPYPGLFSLPYSYMPSAAYFMYPGLGGLYFPPGFAGFPGYFGYSSYGLPLNSPNYAGALYW
ncbi:MAG TPA: hypothetical protein VFI31_04225 [Pirellulales bacterium]|nr:hypothetical protein [Pirellulales bacterium]